jgi:hypothetical protein
MGSNDTAPPPGGGEDRNPATVMPPRDPSPRLAASEVPEAYALAHREMASAPVTQRGYRLFWVRRRVVDWMDLPVGGAYAVIGRHTECDAILSQDPEISLRHLLATTIELADGIALRLIDLQTRVPFFLADDVPRRAIVASGPLAVRVGEYVVGAVPIDAPADQPAPGSLPFPELPPAVVTESSSVPASALPPRAPPSVAAPAERSPPASSAPVPSGSPVSRVTSMPPPPMIGALSRPRPAPVERPPPPPARPVIPPPPETAEGPVQVARGHVRSIVLQGPPCARLTLTRGERSASLELSEAELDIGVIVGRSDRCIDAGLQAVLDTHVSRGHLLLLHHHGVFEAFDLCSTQGTYAGKRQVRRFVLPDEGASLRMAVGHPVVLTWQRIEPVH